MGKNELDGWYSFEKFKDQLDIGAYEVKMTDKV